MELLTEFSWIPIILTPARSGGSDQFVLSETLMDLGILTSLYPTSFFGLFEYLECICVGFHLSDTSPDGRGTWWPLSFLA
ncbi:MAG: hypothetical protein JWM11_4129, partial [Planctomycetaceae bacterium]|nr:hypothetical protein [Planctomycetaceae bacterium]